MSSLPDSRSTFRRIASSRFVSHAITMPGAVDFDSGPGFIRPRRLPHWTRLRVPPQMENVVCMPDATRLEFATDADWLELHVSTTTVTFPGRIPPLPVFALDIDGDSVASLGSSPSSRITVDRATGQILDRIPSLPDRIRFEGLPGRMKTCAIWLPHNAIVDLHALLLPETAQLQRPAIAGKVWQHYGSSISQGMQVTRPTQTWPAVAARLGDYSLRSFAFAGECQLDAFVARAMAEERADIISIKPGINIMTNASMSPRTFHSALHGFLDILRDAGPETPIVVISPIFQAPLAPAVPEFPPASLFRRLRRRWKMNASGARPETAIGREGRKLTSPIIADLIQDVVTARQRAGDNTLRFLDGFSLLGPDQEALLPDGIHPSTEGHRLIGERFARLVFSPTVRPRQRRRA